MPPDLGQSDGSFTPFNPSRVNGVPDSTGPENVRPAQQDNAGVSDANAIASPTPPSTGQSASPAAMESLLPHRRKRNRPALSCVQCRSRKIKCDRMEPCTSCEKSKLNCTFDKSRRPKPRYWNDVAVGPQEGTHGSQGGQLLGNYHGTQYPNPIPSSQPQQPPSLPQSAYGTNGSHGHRAGDSRYSGAGGVSAGLSPSNAAASVLTPSTFRSAENSVHNANWRGNNNETVSRLEDRIQQLEQKLADKAVDPVGSVSNQSSKQVPSHVRGVMSKSRYFGQSHWMNTVKHFPDITNVFGKLEKDNDRDYVPFMVKCKALARSIKKARIGSTFPFEQGAVLPSQKRETADRLVDAYFRTFETVYRILHVPTFYQEYEKYWETPAGTSEGFKIQMKLCMAIGTCFQDDVASLRQNATQWIYEAQYWLAVPEKSRMNLASLQSMCLLHLARETCGIGGDLTWISSGSLMRCAMFMGLHHDPDNLGAMPLLRAELRRRLWATVLEIALQSSLDSGGPPLISLSDYDTKQPGNFNDIQLLDGDHPTSVPRPGSFFTQTSVQLTLLGSFPTRLSVAQYVNGFHSKPSYEQTSRLNAQLLQASAALQYSYDPAGVLPKRLTLFQLRLAEHMVHRFFFVLNQPLLGLARNNADYYFARKACVDSARKLAEGFAKAMPSGKFQHADPVDDFVRLSTAGAGAFRSVPVQCMLTIGLELKWQAHEYQTVRTDAATSPLDPALDVNVGTAAHEPGGVAPRGELLKALEHCVSHQERRISGGETNVKGYVFASALLAQIQALIHGEPNSNVEQVVTESLRASLDHCWRLLEKVAAAEATPHIQDKATHTLMGEDESPAGSQVMGDIFGFGNGWEWEDLRFNFDADYSSMDHAFNFN